jgi:hypothetical protein
VGILPLAGSHRRTRYARIRVSSTLAFADQQAVRRKCFYSCHRLALTFSEDRVREVSSMALQGSTSLAATYRGAHAEIGLLRMGVPLASLLALQGGVALVTLRNTAFQDEAVYISAGQQIYGALLGGPPVPVSSTFAQYFSGDPYLYPVLAGILNSIGGLEAARLLSLVAVMGTTLCVWGITKYLYGSEYGTQSAVFAAAIFAFQSSVLFIARMATFDAMCLLALAVSVGLALKAGAARGHLGALAIGPVLVLAIGLKYAALLWVASVLAILACQSLQHWGWRQMWLRIGLASASLLTIAGICLTEFDRSILAGVSFTTTNRDAISRTPGVVLAREVVVLGGAALALGAAGFMVLLMGRKKPLIALVLMVSALLAPAYHIYTGEAISLHKHMAFAVFFIAPLAGIAVARMPHVTHRGALGHKWHVGIVVCLVLLAMGLGQARWLYHVWGDSSGMVAVLRSLVRSGNQMYLAEDNDVAHYYLQPVTSSWQWVGPYWFQYTDAAHHQLSGVAAYRAAVADGYFDVIELGSGYGDAAFNKAVDDGLQEGKHYELVGKLPSHTVYGDGFIWIWRKHIRDAKAQGQGGASYEGAAPRFAQPMRHAASGTHSGAGIDRIKLA